MDRAETVINEKSNVVVIPNQAIVDKMQEMGLNIDDRITHNPYFLTHLFELFEITQIDDMQMSEEGIVLTEIVSGFKYKFFINANSEDGLTMNCEVRDEHEGLNFVRSRKIISLFPSDTGFKKVVDYQIIFGNMDHSEIVDSNELSITEIDDKGLEVSSNTIRNEVHKKGYIFGSEPKNTPFTSEEYDNYMNKHLEAKAYITHATRVRDARDITTVHETYETISDKPMKKTLHYSPMEMLDIATLEKAREKEKTDVGRLVRNMQTKYDNFDPATGRLMINLVNLLDQDVTICIVKPTEKERMIQKQLLDTYGNNDKRFNV